MDLRHLQNKISDMDSRVSPLQTGSAQLFKLFSVHFSSCIPYSRHTRLLILSDQSLPFLFFLFLTILSVRDTFRYLVHLIFIKIFFRSPFKCPLLSKFLGHPYPFLYIPANCQPYQYYIQFRFHFNCTFLFFLLHYELFEGQELATFNV